MNFLIAICFLILWFVFSYCDLYSLRNTEKLLNTKIGIFDKKKHLARRPKFIFFKQYNYFSAKKVEPFLGKATYVKRAKR